MHGNDPMSEELEKCEAREMFLRTNECLSLQFLRIDAWVEEQHAR